MKVMKRDEREVKFDEDRIRKAITAANADVAEADRLYSEEIELFVCGIVKDCEDLNRAVSVDEIQEFLLFFL